MTGQRDPRPRFFRTPDAFRKWLEGHHDSESELWVGFYKKASGKGGMVYAEAVDEALCYGWIDGLVRSVDDDSYMQRFTPRKANSHWSNVNVKKLGELHAAGRVAPSGLAAFERRTAERTGKASFESPPGRFTPTQRKRFAARRAALEFFESQPPGYRRTAIHWVTTAKREETRERRLEQLIACSAEGRRLPQFISPVAKKR
jgi:uncharacterized protein YdeI (YjbR/CyaY-like superfamily)